MADLCQFWDLTIDGQPMHGYFALALPVLQRERPCVLKVSWINDVTSGEAAALALWNGNGVVQLLDIRSDVGAMLLERLDYRRSLAEVPITEAVQITADILLCDVKGCGKKQGVEIDMTFTPLLK